MDRDPHSRLLQNLTSTPNCLTIPKIYEKYIELFLKSANSLKKGRIMYGKMSMTRYHLLTEVKTTHIFKISQKNLGTYLEKRKPRNTGRGWRVAGLGTA